MYAKLVELIAAVRKTEDALGFAECMFRANGGRSAEDTFDASVARRDAAVSELDTYLDGVISHEL